MKIGYIDTSVLVAMAFDDAGGSFIGRFVKTFDRLYSSSLLEAEFFSAAKRENKLAEAAQFIRPVRFVYPDINLTRYHRQVLNESPIEGSALYHLSCALYLFQRPQDVFFLSLHPPQAALAARLGFQTDFM
ncbi:MAG: PIN domain-containing protein [Deltaproteobacteria bacterium]|nr:PIN domain-containing protein [Deltaproteobacteria bacterium]